MIWSILKPFKAKIGPSEAQRYEPGINQFDACGPACASALMQVLNYPDIEPQDLVGQNYKGGTTATFLNSIIATKYPNPPRMIQQSSNSPINDMTVFGKKGYAAITLFKSNAAAQLVPYSTGIFHWCIPLEDDGSHITLWNPEWGRYETYSYTDFTKAFAGIFDICERRIGIVMTRGMKVNAVEDWYAIYLGRNYGDAGESSAEIMAWANQISDDGENLDQIRGQFVEAAKKDKDYKKSNLKGITFTATVQ